MVGKLMKYELRATARVVLPTFLGLLLFSIVARFSVGSMMRTPSSLTEGGLAASFLALLPRLGILLYGLSMMAVWVVVLVVIIQRFYKNLTGDEGYLMFTLPVRPWQLVWSKLLVAALWQLLSAVAVVASLAILLLQGEIAAGITQALGWLWREVGPYLPTGSMVWLLWVAAALVSTLANTMLIYAAIAVGHTIKNHRVLGAILAYFGLSTVIQLVSTPLGLLLVGPLMKLDLDTAAGTIRFVHEILFYSPLLALALSALMLGGLTYLTNQVFEKQLNLE